MKALATLLAAGAMLAAPPSWSPVAVTASGDLWSIDRASAYSTSTDGALMHWAMVKRERGENEETYAAGVPARYCGAAAGDLTMIRADGDMTLTVVWRTGQPSQFAAIAAAVCNLHGPQRKRSQDREDTPPGVLT